MLCTVNGFYARTLAKAVQTLSKIGTDLFIEAGENGLVFRTVNSIESATARIGFNRSCFLMYHVQRGEENNCVVAMKAWLNVFRNMKHVEECELKILKEECKLSIRLKCRSDMIKIAILSVIGNQNISAEESLEDTTNIVAGNYKVFSEMLRTFMTNGDEVTLVPTTEMLIAQNYVENARVNHNFMRSKIQFSSCEFDTYRADPYDSITLATREVRAFVLFAEALKEKMTFKFSKPGSPCYVEINKLSHIECMLIVSTLCMDDVSFSESYMERTLSGAIVDTSSTLQKRKNSKETNKRAPSEIKRRIVDDTTLSNSSDLSLFQFNEDVASSSRKNANSVQAPRMVSEPLTKTNTGEIVVNNAAVLIENTSHTESGPQVTFYNTPAPADEYDIDCVQESPERANFVRSIFSRCFQSTYLLCEPSPSSQLYAPNSDTES